MLLAHHVSSAYNAYSAHFVNISIVLFYFYFLREKESVSNYCCGQVKNVQIKFAYIFDVFIQRRL